MKDLLGREVPIRSVLTNFSRKLVTTSAIPERVFILDGFSPEVLIADREKYAKDCFQYQ